MQREESEAVSLRAMAPSPSKKNSGLSGEPTLLADVNRLFEERFDRQQKRMHSFFDGMDSCFDRWNKKLDEILDEARVIDQHVTSLEHGAPQSRLAMEADGPANIKARERTEGAAIVVQAMRGDSCTTAQKVQDRPKTSISFGVEAERPDLPCRKDILVEEGTTSPESCLPSLEMRSPTAAGGLVPTGKASTATKNHLQRATSSVLRDRGDESRGGLEDEKIMDFYSIRLARQSQLLETASNSILPEDR